MGIFDRFRSTAASGDAGPDKSAEDATRLIEQGQAFQAQGRLEQAMQCFREAIRLAPNPARAHLNRGNVLLLRGDLDGALAAFRTALEHQPDYAGAHYNIGNALLGNKQFDAAVSSYRSALEINPDYAEAHCSLGVALKELAQLDEAVASFRRALDIDPALVEARHNLNASIDDLLNKGHILLDSGQPGEAAAQYRRVLEIKSDHPEAHAALGVALNELGQLDSAVESYRRALILAPGFAGAHGNLGITLQALGQLEEAAAHYRRAIEINPDYAEAHFKLGNVLKDLGQLDDAVASYRIALKLEPGVSGIHSNLGVALQELGQFENAVACYRQALEIEPNKAQTHVNMGTALQALWKFEEAAATFSRAIEIKPDYAEAHYNLGNALKDLGHIDKAVPTYRDALGINPDLYQAYNNLGAALQELGQLDGATASFLRALEIKPDYIDTLDNLLLSLNYSAGHSPAQFFEQARQYGRVVTAMAGARFTNWQSSVHPERLRIGLVSGDFREHSVGHFLEGLLAHVDPSRIELIAYPTHHIEDKLTARIRPHFSAWQPLFGKNDEAAARLIHADKVHILLDVSGHTEHNRLPVFAWKPAPVQATWLGLPTTTGMAEIDYVLGDPHASPPEFDNHFSESVWRMPDTYLCLTAPGSSVKVAALPARSTGFVTFGSFNNLTKMNDRVVAVWARVLDSVPNSRLLLKNKQLGIAVLRESTLRRFAACGIAPDRLILAGILASRDDHLAAYNKVDIALDTFPYPGVTTSAEALWMGVPVLSLRGDRFLSRTAESIARNVGLPDWIAADEDEYVAKAVAFSSDLDHLAAQRANLRGQVLASPLFDAPRFARNFENALWGMWQRYQTQQ